MTNMRNDIKIKRLISKYGLEGYGLYNLILESITESLTTDSPVPDLQETCEDIAEFFNGNTAKINEIAAFMVNQGLIEINELTARITCNKIYKYLEQSMTRSKSIRSMIDAYKNNKEQIEYVCHAVSETEHDKSERIEENRIEENRIEEDCSKTKFKKPTHEEIQQYLDERKIKEFTANGFYDYYESKGWMIGRNKMKDWKAAVRTWENNNKKRTETKPIEGAIFGDNP